MRDSQLTFPAPGDLIWIRRQRWRVRSTHTGDGLTRVRVEDRLDTGVQTFLLPADRVVRDSLDGARQERRVPAARGLAWLAACAARAHPAFTPATIIRANSTLLAYQLEPALAMLAGTRRVLIADDVGLGKTVQAALIVAEVLQQRTDARVLVLAPASLLAQWRDELRTRFDIASVIADTHHFARLRSDRPYIENPWQRPGVRIASPDFVKQPHVLEGMTPEAFDLIVIDEAHMLSGHSQRHSAISDIARLARQVVMLTATPHDGSDARFSRLMALGATGASRDGVLIFRRAREASQRRVRHVNTRPGVNLSRVLSAIDSFERLRSIDARTDGRQLICAVFRKRALSSMAALVASLTRRLDVLDGTAEDASADDWIQPGLVFAGEPDADVAPHEEWAALRAESGLPIERERTWLRQMQAAAARGASQKHGDAKLARLTTLLRRSREPVVVFTEYRDSLLAVWAVASGVRRVSVLHGGMSGAAQQRALRDFLDGAADVLLSTDVASQGLNLQHRARWVVHFDLPWTPMRLEQRAGRVDRIGQTRLVHVTHMGVRHAADVAARRHIGARQHARDAAPLTTCHRWTRVATKLAQWFARQRALGACWRGPDPVSVFRAQLPGRQLARLCGDASGPLTIVEIPIVSGTGEILERHLGWRRSVAPSEPDDAPMVLTRRAQVLTARVARRRARVEDAQAPSEPERVPQPGLFDPRDLPTRVPDGPSLLDAHTASSPSAHDDVRVGPPRPVLRLDVRR